MASFMGIKFEQEDVDEGIEADVVAAPKHAYEKTDVVMLDPHMTRQGSSTAKAGDKPRAHSQERSSRSSIEDDEGSSSVDNTRLYSILGVSTAASEDDINHAYKKLSKKYDPDVKEDAKKLKELKKAVAVLSHPDRRKEYDADGEEYLKRLKAASESAKRSPSPNTSQRHSNAGSSRSNSGIVDQAPTVTVTATAVATAVGSPIPVVAVVSEVKSGSKDSAEGSSKKKRDHSSRSPSPSPDTITTTATATAVPSSKPSSSSGEKERRKERRSSRDKDGVGASKHHKQRQGDGQQQQPDVTDGPSSSQPPQPVPPEPVQRKMSRNEMFLRTLLCCCSILDRFATAQASKEDLMRTNQKFKPTPKPKPAVAAATPFKDGMNMETEEERQQRRAERLQKAREKADAERVPEDYSQYADMRARDEALVRNEKLPWKDRFILFICYPCS